MRTDAVRCWACGGVKPEKGPCPQCKPAAGELARAVAALEHAGPRKLAELAGERDRLELERDALQAELDRLVPPHDHSTSTQRMSIAGGGWASLQLRAIDEGEPVALELHTMDGTAGWARCIRIINGTRIILDGDVPVDGRKLLANAEWGNVSPRWPVALDFSNPTAVAVTVWATLYVRIPPGRY